MYAFLGFNAARFAQAIVNGLAVAGGFLLGYVLTMAAGWAIDRWIARGKTPAGVHKVARFLGGIAMAVLVALIVFGHGQGWTLFGGGLAGEDNGTGKSTAAVPAVTKKEPDHTEKKPPTAPPDTTPARERVRVTMLGGRDVKDQKFYLIDDDPTPRTLAEVKEAVLKKKETTPEKLAVEIRFAAQNTLPQDHPAVQMLARWARETAGLTVTFPAETP